MSNDDFKYLKKLSEDYQNVSQAAARVIELRALLSLPKGTEHFISDVHGEFEAFFHVIKSGSGAIRRKIDDALGDSISDIEKKELATIIYYPEEKMELINRVGGLSADEYAVLIERIIKVSRQSIEKYPAKAVWDAVPDEYEYIVEELINADPEISEKKEYYSQILSAAIDLGRGDEIIAVFAKLIQRMVIAQLHVIGDIYDRGPGPHFIMDFLDNYKNFDVQWGNHDVVWMGAALGHGACICNILRNSLRYDGLDIVSNGYGINMIPLMQFASKYYDDDPCECYAIKDKKITYDRETQLTLKMHKAISIIQWKLEGLIIMDNPEFNMDDRLILDKINYENGTVKIDGRELKLKDSLYPTVDPNAPFELNDDECELMDKLILSFKSCEKLRRHANLLVSNGGMYLVHNGNLMFHGCMPLDNEGGLKECTIFGKKYRGREWNDALEAYVRKGFTSDNIEDRQKGADVLWYLWNAPDSPIFGKNKMATFERYVLDDKEAQKEVKNSYYKLMKEDEGAEDTAKMLLKEFGLDPDNGIIINGHVPVKQERGESPIKANGRLYVIDGGFSKTYHGETGIAGYTLVSNSKGKILVAHKPFTSTEDAIKNGEDIISEEVSKVEEIKRIFIRDTDDGEKIKQEIEDLLDLIDAFKTGEIKERKAE